MNNQPDFEIIEEGDANGNHMIVRLVLPSGLEVYGLPTENNYGGHWDLGPTWNWLVMSDRPFLFDTGCYGQGDQLVEKIKNTGLSLNDLSAIVLSHGHEDHDGGLPSVVSQSRATIKAHPIYERLIRYYPQETPEGSREDFPARCWHCFMPDSFTQKYCGVYQQTRSQLSVESLNGSNRCLGGDITCHHVPGHSPDAIAVVLGHEAILVGDTVLPGITPWPTEEAMYDQVRHILPPDIVRADQIYGLSVYIRSLKKLKRIGHDHPDMRVLPAHRLLYGDQWNLVELEPRIDELIQHHVDRCGGLLELLAEEPQTSKQAAIRYFPENLLKGFGIFMAEKEVLTHFELLIKSGDVARVGSDRYVATGSSRFHGYIRDLTG